MKHSPYLLVMVCTVAACAGPDDEQAIEQKAAAVTSFFGATVTVPAYFSASSAFDSEWNQVSNMFRGSVIFNLASGQNQSGGGPGPTQDPNVVNRVNQLNASVHSLYGYVANEYGRYYYDITADIDHWRTWYGITNIFFDVSARLPFNTDLSKMEALVAYVTQFGGQAEFNWGAVPTEAFANCLGDQAYTSSGTPAIHFVTQETFEDVYLNDANWPTWINSYRADHFTQIIHDATPDGSTVDTPPNSIADKSAARNASSIFITDLKMRCSTDGECPSGATCNQSVHLCYTSNGVGCTMDASCPLQYPKCLGSGSTCAKESDPNPYRDIPNNTIWSTEAGWWTVNNQNYGWYPSSQTDKPRFTNCPVQNNCGHDLCVSGVALASSCDSCASSICSAMPSCCDSTSGSWSSSCVGAVAWICGITCQTPGQINVRTAIRTSNGVNFSTAENDGGSYAATNRTTIGAWELFEIEDLNGGHSQLMSGDTVHIRHDSASGQSWYASADQNQNGQGGGGGVGSTLRVNRTAAGPWETFTIVKPGGGPINNGDQVNFLSANSYYASADNGGGDSGDGSITVDRTQANAWETFTLVFQ